jgi:hypothetical protein
VTAEYAHPVDLIEEDAHLALAYIDAVTRTGTRLSSADLMAYVDSPVRVRPRSRMMSGALETVGKGIAQLFATMETVSIPGESLVDFLVRVNWVKLDGESVSITAVGRALLAHAERPPVTSGSDEPLIVTLDPKDPLAYLRVFNLLSSQGPGLIVDPYLDFERLGDLLEISEVSRILTSNRSSNRRLDTMSRQLGAYPEPPEMRTLELAKLHDRFYFADAGAVYSLGSSLNSISRRPGVITPIEDSAARSAIRSVYEQLWEEAAPLGPVREAGAGAKSELS